MTETSYVELTFRFISANTPIGELSGFALWCKSEAEAREVYRSFHDYLTSNASSRRRLTMAFLSNNTGSYDLDIQITVGPTVRLISVNGINREYIERLRSSLLHAPYFFILAGYDDSLRNPQLLPVREYHLFRSEINIDNETVRGTRNMSWPHDLLIDALSAMTTGSE